MTADLGQSVDPAKLTRRFCDHFIEIGDDPWAGTYCKLLEGHDGDHSPLYPDERRDRMSERFALGNDLQSEDEWQREMLNRSERRGERGA